MQEKTTTMNDIRSAFLSFFKTKGHEIYKSSSLIPENDTSLIFVNSGMVPFKQFFIKGGHKDITSCQKCVRAGGKHNDLENVGFTTRHHTFFEMLGNFSFGNYFKEEAILLANKFLTEELKLDKSKLLITVYHDDDEAFNIWNKIGGFSEIQRIKTQDNFWSMGEFGPCGPCSEIFYQYNNGTSLEIWNLVFMQYNKLINGEIENLPIKCIDTGMGLERISSVIQGVEDNYELDIFKQLIKQSQKISNNITNTTAHKVIADHLRAAVFLIADGAYPSNKGTGYVLRRIIRRAVRYISQIHNKPMLYILYRELADLMGNHYREILEYEKIIEYTLKNEEELFLDTLDKGMDIIQDAIPKLHNNIFPGDLAFKLYDTYGFPIDLTSKILQEQGITIEMKAFDSCMSEQKNRSNWQAGETKHTNSSIELPSTVFIRDESEIKSKILGIKYQNQFVNSLSLDYDCCCEIILDRTVFYAESGGQEGDHGRIVKDKESLEIIDTQKQNNIHSHICINKNNRKYNIELGETITCLLNTQRRNNLSLHHSATHLLHHALKKVLGTHIAQRGSLVAEDHLRFDFSHNASLSSEQLEEISTIINNQIKLDSDVRTEIMPLEEARNIGATALFGEKYSEIVRVVKISDSIELCGGTHVNSTAKIIFFQILKEQSIGSGIRRIKATVGHQAIELLKQSHLTITKELASTRSELVKAKKSNQLEVNKLYGRILLECNTNSIEQSVGKYTLLFKQSQNVPHYIIPKHYLVLSDSKTVHIISSFFEDKYYLTLTTPEDLKISSLINLDKYKCINKKESFVQILIQNDKHEEILEEVKNNLVSL